MQIRYTQFSILSSKSHERQKELRYDHKDC